MSLTKIPYHILFYDEKTEPYRDCQHKAYITDDSTYNDFIDCIIKGLGKFESYNDIPKQIRRNKNTMIITIGAKANQQQDIMKQTVTNHQIVQLNDIVNVPKHKCVYFIITKKKHNNINTNTNTNTSTQTQNRNTNRKRNRKPLHNANKMENNNSNTKLNAPPPKRRKKQQIIIKHSNKDGKNKSLIKHEFKHECLWILTDATTLNDEYEQNVSVNKVKECIDDIINNNWVRQDCPTHYIALYSYGTDLIEETKVLNYSNENKTLILNRLNAIENTKSMSWTNALLQFINIIQSKKDNIKCNHRIVLVCSKSIKTRLHKNEIPIADDIKSKLLALNIIFDCIHITCSTRANWDLNKTAERYWNTNEVLCSDFMFPNKRNVKKEEAIVID